MISNTTSNKYNDIASQSKQAIESLSDERKTKLKQDTNSCTVRAVMYCTGISYPLVYQAYAEEGRRHRRGTQAYMQKAVYEKLGFTVTEIFNSMITNWSAADNTFIFPKSMTIKAFEKLKLPGHYHIRVTGHALSIIDGVTHDFTRGSSKRIWTIWKIDGPFVNAAETAAIDPFFKKYVPLKVTQYITRCPLKRGSVYVYTTSTLSGRHAKLRKENTVMTEIWEDGVLKYHVQSDGLITSYHVELLQSK